MPLTFEEASYPQKGLQLVIDCLFGVSSAFVSANWLGEGGWKMIPVASLAPFFRHLISDIFSGHKKNPILLGILFSGSGAALTSIGFYSGNRSLSTFEGSLIGSGIHLVSYGVSLQLSHCGPFEEMEREESSSKEPEFDYMKYRLTKVEGAFKSVGRATSTALITRGIFVAAKKVSSSFVSKPFGALIVYPVDVFFHGLELLSTSPKPSQSLFPEWKIDYDDSISEDDATILYSAYLLEFLKQLLTEAMGAMMGGAVAKLIFNNDLSLEVNEPSFWSMMFLMVAAKELMTGTIDLARAKFFDREKYEGKHTYTDEKSGLLRKFDARFDLI